MKNKLVEIVDITQAFEHSYIQRIYDNLKGKSGRLTGESVPDTDNVYYYEVEIDGDLFWLKEDEFEPTNQ